MTKKTKNFTIFGRILSKSTNRFLHNMKDGRRISGNTGGKSGGRQRELEMMEMEIEVV